MAGRGSVNEGVYFDVTHVGEKILMERAPLTYVALNRAGLDLAREPIELGLVVQNFNGGILIDENGFTGVPGLFAAGEITGGVHGSDRPGGNNLIDTQVFGYRAGIAASLYAQDNHGKRSTWPGRMKFPPVKADDRESAIIRASEALFYQEMTIVRTAGGLRRTLDFIAENIREGISPMLRNRLLVGRLLAMAMLTREESRGTHYREDYPDSSRRWERQIILCKGPSGDPELTTSTL
jgi:fumarate reductase (CoM/CoB) subunit A